MIVFAMAVATGEAEMAIDSLTGIRDLYPDAKILIWDDATRDGTWEKICDWSRQNDASTVQRNQETNGYLGLPKTIFKMFSHLSNWEGVEFVVKLDPDACLLKGGLIEVVRQRFFEFGPGICGSYKVSPSGALRDFRTHWPRLLLDLLPIGLAKCKGERNKVLRTAPVFYWKFLFRALRNGYALGEHCLGGLYVLSGSTLYELASVGFWESIQDGHSLGLVTEEDVLLAIGARSIGHRLSSMNAPSGPMVAWLQHLPPIPIPPEELCCQPLLAVHPIKKDAAARQIFAARRTL